MTAVAARSGARSVWNAALRSPALRLVVKRLLLAVPIILGVTILDVPILDVTAPVRCRRRGDLLLGDVPAGRLV